MTTALTYHPTYHPRPRTRMATPFFLNSQFSILNFTSTPFTPVTSFTLCTLCPHFTLTSSLDFHIPHYRNLFNGQEADNEVYGDGAVLGYEFRQYDARIGKWWSVDPMSDKNPGVGSYVFCMDSPMMLVDPNGKDAWKPEVDSKGNILAIAEPGDNQTTLKEFMGPAYSDKDIHDLYKQLQNGHINLTESIGGVFQLMTDAINDARRDPDFENSNNYNCWGATLALMRGKQLYGDGVGIYPLDNNGVGLNSNVLFDIILDNAYIPVEKDQLSVGKTIMRFGFFGTGKTTHASIFMGVDNSGNEYTFTKNGWTPRPIICKTSQISWKYLSVSGINFNESGYYINPQ